MYKPVLIPAYKSNYSIIEDLSNRLETKGMLFSPSPHGDKVNYHHTILVDTEAEIVEGDWKHNPALNTTWQRKRVGKSEFAKIQHKATSKIISSTNKSHNIPQLSPQSIQLLINYYNEHKCMPESVDVETHYIPGGRVEACPDTRLKGYGVQLKFNQQGEVDITIPEVEGKMISINELPNLLNLFCKDHSLQRGCQIMDWDIKQWISKNI